MFDKEIIETLWKEIECTKTSCQESGSPCEQSISVSETFESESFEEVKASIEISSAPASSDSYPRIPNLPDLDDPNDVFDRILQRVRNRGRIGKETCTYETHCYEVPDGKGGTKTKCIRFKLCVRNPD